MSEKGSVFKEHFFQRYHFEKKWLDFRFDDWGTGNALRFFIFDNRGTGVCAMNEVIRQVRPSGLVAMKYFTCNSPYQCLMGPVGSGKSTTNIMKILALSACQNIDPTDNVRRSRWAIIRNTKPQLKQTTIKTWNDYVPRSYGRFVDNNSQLSHEIAFEGDDGVKIEIEILFLSLDKEEDVQKLLSLELTGAFINEAREIPEGLISSLFGRTGRYPSKARGGCFWHGILMDTNPPDTENWIYKKFVEFPSEGWRLFRQPSGLSADAENVENLIDGYYQGLCSGASQDWIDVYVHGKFGYSKDGRPVFSSFNDSVHVAKNKLVPLPDLEIRIGFDAGRTPAAVFGQRLPNGQLRILDELFMEKTGPVEFGQTVRRFIVDRFLGCRFSNKNFADPAAAMGDSETDPSWIRVVERETGLGILPCPGNNHIAPRLDSVEGILKEMVDGEPAFLLSPNCTFLRKGFNSGYRYKRIRGSDGGFSDEPEKNQFSHVHDALQYLVLGDGGYESVTGARRGGKTKNIRMSTSKFKLFGR